MRNKNQQKGFTLIELLVVIVILGILSTISVGTFRSYFAKARDSERVSTVQNLAMMMKVDSGGHGDCTVYNYKGNGAGCATTGVGVLDTVLKALLTNNDYSMPEAKNGLVYHYAFYEGDTEGDNEFFVMVGAEEDNPQNGKQSGAGEYIFVDGTTKGIASATKGEATATGTDPGGCTIVSGAPTCFTNWSTYTINSDGELTLLVAATT